MAFESLSERFQSVFKKMRKEDRLTEKNMEEALREIKVDGGSISGRLTKEIEEMLDQKSILYIPGHQVETTSGLEKLYFKYIASKVNTKKAVRIHPYSLKKFFREFSVLQI